MSTNWQSGNIAAHITYQALIKNLFSKNTKMSFRSRMMKNEPVTFISVCHKDARHEFLLAVGPEGVSDHDLILCQLALQFQGIKPVELDLGCQTFRKATVQKP